MRTAFKKEKCHTNNCFTTVPNLDTNYQYDGGENQILMTDNYAESAVAFPLFVAPSIVAPLTEIPTPVAASVTVNENGFCSFEVSIESAIS